MSQINKPIRDFLNKRVIMKTLGELCKVKTGPNINKQIIAKNPGEFPVINSGKEPLGYFGEFNVDDDPIGIASRGSVGLVTWTPGRYFRGNLNYSCTIFDPTILDRRFLYYHLLKSYKEIRALATHQGIPALNASNLRLLQVPVPPLEVQREIVKVLDKFTQLEAELEAELEARRKQYEHYRDRLLTFEEKR